MKKLLFIIGFLFIALLGYSQVDSVELTDQDVLNEIPALNLMTHFNADGSTINLVQGQNIQPLFLSGQNYYFRRPLNDLIIGTTPSTLTKTKLWVQGTGHFTDQLTLDSKLNIQQSSIYQASSELYFFDPTNGVVSLSDLNSATRSSSASNGITTSGDAFILGGSFGRNTITDLNDYSVQWGTGSDYLILDESSGTARLNAANRLTLYAGDITLQATGFRLRSDGINPITWYDYTTTPYGATMPDWEDYWANIEADDEKGAIMTKGMVEDYLGVGGGDGVSWVEDDNCLDDADTAYTWVFSNSDGDTAKLVQMVVNESIDDNYIASVDISSANILAGDSLSIIAAPGSGKAIIPTKIAYYFDYGTATYASGATSYIRSGEFGAEANVYSIGTGLITKTADYLTTDIEEATAGESASIRESANTARGLNQPYWIQIGSGFTTGDGIIKIIVWYVIADFN